MTGAKGIILVMQNSKPGREQEHIDWYVRHHVKDVSGIQGTVRGEYTRLANPQGTERWNKAACYWTAGDPLPVLAETMQNVGAGVWDMSGADALDRDTVRLTTGLALTDRIRSPHGEDAIGQDRVLFIVMTNCTPGDDDAFNAWYNDRHIPDVLDVPGFVAAQRFRFIDPPNFKPAPYQYLALYEIRADEADSALAELTARAGTDRMVLSPTLDTADVHAGVFAVLATCEGASAKS